MTLKKAMEKCETCFDTFGKPLEHGVSVKIMHHAALNDVAEDAIAEGTDINEPGSLHYKMNTACGICDFDAPRIYNLGRAYIRD